jgi:hypothetical protein
MATLKSFTFVPGQPIPAGFTVEAVRNWKTVAPWGKGMKKVKIECSRHVKGEYKEIDWNDDEDFLLMHYHKNEEFKKHVDEYKDIDNRIEFVIVKGVEADEIHVYLKPDNMTVDYITDIGDCLSLKDENNCNL